PYLYADDYDFKPGLWEISSTNEIIEIEAPPAVENGIRNMPKQVENVCIEDPTVMYEPEPGEQGECNVDIERKSANKLVFESFCTDPYSDGSVKTVGELNLSGDTLTMLTEHNVSDVGFSMKMETLSHGKYIGACN
uniref:DUF3617 domain-containing protein n=1 Tax=Thaumasiovibrio occultus TaxID=1891184 RepID=UPI000B34DC3E